MFGFNELPVFAKAVIALAFVLVLVLIAGLLLRRVAGGKMSIPGLAPARGRQPRLGIVDMFELDRQRQLVLLRRDNVEHLVMIGGPNDIVIEAGIARPPARQAAQPEAEAAPGAMRRPAAPLPEADPASVAPAVAAAAIGAAATAAAAPDRKVEPQFDAPASAPAPSEPVPPLRGSEAPLPVLRAESPVPKADPAPPELDDKQIAAAFEAELARVEATPVPPPKPIIERIENPAPVKLSKAELSEMTRDLQEAMKRSAPAVKPFGAAAATLAAGAAALGLGGLARAKRAESAEAPPLSTAAPETVPEPAAESVAEPLPEPEGAAVEEPAPPAEVDTAVTPVVVAEPIESVEEAIEAPAPAPEAKPEPAPSALSFDNFESELAAILAMEVTPTKPDIHSEPDPVPAVSVETALSEPSEPAAEPADDPPAAQASILDELEPAPPVQPPADTADVPVVSETKKRPADDPFSVDAIEAEFARLLNRPVPPKA